MSLRIIKAKKNTDVKDHFRIEEYANYIQVKTETRSYRFSLGKDEFLKRYTKNWAILEVSSKGVKSDNEIIFFSDKELSSIKQKIVLHWINSGIRGNLDHPQTVDIVRYASTDKYGTLCDRSEILAASTLNMSLSDYRNNINKRLEFERRR